LKITISYSVCDSEIEKIEQLLPEMENVLSDVSSEILKNKDIKAYIKTSSLFDNCPKEVIIDLYITNNDEIQALNSEYRGKDVPTDVLSFAMQEAEETIMLPVLHLGEIIISLDKLVEQAKANGHNELNEFVFLLVHGILHLFGVHHETDEAYQYIMSIQNDILTKVLS